MYRLSTYRTALKFEGRPARNFADWLRTDRESNPEMIDGEIAYDPEFVRRSLRKRLSRIEKSYPDSYPFVFEFVNGADILSISATVETDTESIEPDAEPIESGAEPIETKPEQPTKTKQHEPTEQTVDTDDTKQSDIDTETENEIDIKPTFEPDRIEQPEGMETETIADRPEHETDTKSSGTSEPAKHVDPVNESKFRRMLTNPETMLFGTVAVIFVFLPFTVLNLYQYINIETNSIWGDWGVFLLCCGIAFVWDFSILLFAVNGKHRISQIGAGVLFVFMASKFDFFKRVFDLFGADGEWWQLMFVLSAIVFYSPVLIHQYTKLSVKNEPK